VAQRRSSIRVRRAVVLAERAGRLLMVRQGGRLLAGLWEPPGIDVSGKGVNRASLRAALGRAGVSGRLTDTGRIVRHTITHRRIEVDVWRARDVRDSRTRPSTAGARWIDPRRPSVPLTALARKLASLTDR
jgi:adenine-specific DNA glycosylase